MIRSVGGAWNPKKSTKNIDPNDVLKTGPVSWKPLCLKGMKKLFKWLFFVTAVLFVGLLVLLYNPGLAKGPLERYLSDVAGYPIHLDGELEINIGRLTVLTATNLHVSGPDWARRQDLLAIGNLSLVLSTKSLFEDIVVFNSLQVDNLQLDLEINTDGKGNWISANTQASESDKDNDKPAVIFNNIQLNDTDLRYVNGEKGLEHVLHITSLLQNQQSDGMLQITLNGDFNSRPVELSGTVGPYLNLLAGRNIAYTVSGHFGTLNITGRGLIDDLLEPRRPQFSIEMQGPNIDEITAMLGIEDLGSGGFSLRARGDEINDYYAVGIIGDIGDVSLDVSAKVSDLSQLDEVDLNLAINGPSLGSLTRVFGVENWPDKPFSLKGDVERVGGTLNISNLTLNIGGTELMLDALLSNFPNLDASRIRLSISGDDIEQFRDLVGLPGIATGAFEIDGKLDVSANGVELLLVEIKTSLGHLTLSGTLGAAPDYTGSKFHLHLDGFDAHALMSAFNIDALPEEPFSLDTRGELVDNGLVLEQSVLVTSKEERLELDGLITFNSGGKGTDVEVKLSGLDLARTLQHLVGDTKAPDLPYTLNGRVRVVDDGVLLENIKGQIGKTELNFDGMISNHPEWAGSNVLFAIKGPDLNELLADQYGSDLPSGAFDSSGHITLSTDTLSINDFRFETDQAHGLIKLEFGWPVSSNIDARFNVNVWGDDIRYLLPSTDSFEPDMAAYKIIAIGQKQGDLISVQQFDVDIGNLQVSLTGQVDDDPTDENVNIRLSAHSRDISALGRLNGEPLPAMALSLSADIKGNSRQFVLHDLVATLGESHIAGTLDVSLKDPKPKIKLEAKSDYIDIRPFFSQSGPDDEAATATDPERLIPAIPLPLDILAAADVSINLSIGELRHQQDRIRNLDFVAELQAGHLSVPQLSFEGPRGRLRASLSIRPMGSGKADVRIELNAENFVLNLTGHPEDRLHQVPAVDIYLHFNGQGSNLQEVAGTLDGALYLGSDGGILEGVNLSILDTFILEELFRLITPKADKNNDLNLSCVATILKITDGLVETNPALAFTTNKISLVSKGTLDLKTEAINLNFNATPNKALKISASELVNPYILVSGTLSKPVVGLDPAKVLVHGSVAIGTAGISILAKGVFDRVGSKTPLCQEMLGQVQQQQN